MKVAFEFVNLWLAFPVTLAGFALAFWQLRRTATAANTAATTAINTAKALSGNLLVLIIHQLSNVEREIDRAVDNGERTVVLEYLRQWKFQAGQLRSLVQNHSDDERELERAIQASIVAVSLNKTNISDQEHKLQTAVSPVQAAIAKVSEEFGRLAADRTIKIGSDSNRGRRRAGSGNSSHAL